MGKHLDTPTRTRIRVLYSTKGISQLDLARKFRIAQTTISKVIRSPVDRRHDPQVPEKRGRKSKLSDDDLNSMIEAVTQNGCDGHDISYEQARQITRRDIPQVSLSALNRVFHSANFGSFIAVSKPQVSAFTARRRVEYAEKLLEQRPNARDWRDVLFFGECHFGWGGSTKKKRIIRQKGHRFDADCAQKDEKGIHVWAAIGYDFKSELIEYEVPGNTNGKMSQKVYIEAILEPYIKQLMIKKDFVWEEDGDSGHGPPNPTGKKDSVSIWKLQNGLQCLRNALLSPDLAPIEACWSPPKQYVRKYTKWDDSTLRGLVDEGWERCHQNYINFLTMPERLKQVVELGGQMTPW